MSCNIILTQYQPPNSWYVFLSQKTNNHPFGVGDHFQVLKASEGTCNGKVFWGVGDHFQVLKVSEGTWSVLRTSHGSPLARVRPMVPYGIN